MIDLNYHPKKQPKGWEPEEKVMAVFTALLWIAITLLFVRAL